MHKLRTLLLVGTLKPDNDLSNTYLLTQFMAKHLEDYGVECEILRLFDYNIRPGEYTKMGIDDDWPQIFEKILSSDIIIFATPVWWAFSHL